MFSCVINSEASDSLRVTWVALIFSIMQVDWRIRICTAGNLSFISTGATVAFSQFDINQFRAIAWFNVAAGLGFVVLLVVVFRGESGCTKPAHIGLKFYHMCGSQRPKVTCSDVVVSFPITEKYVHVFMLALKMASGVHFGIRSLQGQRVGLLYVITHPLPE